MAKARNRCPTVISQDNGTETKVSAHWLIDSQGHGRCLRHNGGKCGLDGEPCPFGGKQEFPAEYRWANIYAEKYYLGGLHVHGISIEEML